MLNYIFGSKSLVNEKLLERNHIQIINYKDIKINKNQVTALTASGKFYNGTYKNEAVSIKIVDICKDESIINEFIYWQEFKNKDCFLKFYGVSLNGSEACLIFEFFGFTLETALRNKILKSDNLPKIAKQILNILEIMQKQHKMIKDLRPGVLGITENSRIKLLDFGFLISEKPNNIESIDKERNKYRAYESFIYLTEELPYDIWSFGCVLIDLFSTKDPIYKLNLTEDEIRKMHEIEAFPIISDEFSGFLREIIVKCLERIPDKRIHIEELVESLSVFLQNISSKNNFYFSKNYLDDKHHLQNGGKKEDKYNQKNYQFYSDAEKKFEKMTHKINTDINDKNILMKNNVEAIHDECITKISENYTQIKRIISEAVTYKIEASDKIDEKIRERILAFQEKTASLLGEIVDYTNTINEMKSSIINLNSMNNPETFTKLIESIKNNRRNLEDFIQSYSEAEDFDIIYTNLQENHEVIQDYRELSENYELLLIDILEVIKKHNEKFCKNSNIKSIAKKLEIDIDLHDNDAVTEFDLDFYAKVQDDSNLIIIYNFQTKKFLQITNDFFFFSKCNSYFIKTTQENQNKFLNFSIYVSGGLAKNQDYLYMLLNNEISIDEKNKIKKISIKNFYEIKIYYDIEKNKFSFDMVKLSDMNEGRYSHSIIQYKDYLIAVSGQNTKKCEIYSIKNNTWKMLPELPTICINSSLTIVDNHLYCISGSSTVNSFDCIYRLSLNNIDKYSSEIKGFEDFLDWENLVYYFSYKNFNLKKGRPRLRRGSAILNMGGDSIFLFGGFDNDNIYDDIFEVFLKKTEEEKNVNINSHQNNIKNTNKKEGEKNKNNIFEKSDKDIEENNNQENNNQVNNGDMEHDEFDQEDIPDAEVENVIKIEKKLTTLPIKTFFTNNIIIINNRIIMVDGYNNSIEYDINNNQFNYFT